MSAGEFLGVIGGLAGLGALALQGYERWTNRVPSLRLHVPIITIGTMDDGNHSLTMLCKISNLSQKPCHLYWETMKADLFVDGHWLPTKVNNIASDASPIFKNLNKYRRAELGIDYYKYFNKHEAQPIKNEMPLMRLFCFIESDRKRIENARGIRFKVKCSQGKNYIITSKSLAGQE